MSVDDQKSVSLTMLARLMSIVFHFNPALCIVLIWAAVFCSFAAANMMMSSTQVIILTGGLVTPLLAFLFSSHSPLLAAQLKVVAGRLPSLPPGCMGSPYWGETLQYMQSWKHFANPDIWYDERRAKFGNIFKTSLLGSPTIVMLGPEANKFVLSNENRLFESCWPRSLRELEGKNAVSMVQDEAHKRLRRAVNTFLNISALHRFRDCIEDIVERELTEGWKPSGEVILAFPALQKLAFQLNAELFMGLKPGPELERLHHHYENFTAGLESQPLNLPWTVFGKAKTARKVLLKYMFGKITARRQELAMGAETESEARDLLDVLVMSRDEETGSLYTVEEIGDNMLLMVHAGQDTTASALAVTLKHLSQSGDVLAQLTSECRSLAASQAPGQRVNRDQLKSVDLLRWVISEGLRMCPPVSGFFKRAKYDLVFDGYTIPKGWTVHLATRYTHLKKEFFSDPQTFQPSRFQQRHASYTYVPFGQGARICPGMEFAKVTMELFLYHFLIKFDWQVADPDENIVVRTFSPYPERGLPMRVAVASKPSILPTDVEEVSQSVSSVESNAA